MPRARASFPTMNQRHDKVESQSLEFLACVNMLLKNERARHYSESVQVNVDSKLKYSAGYQTEGTKIVEMRQVDIGIDIKAVSKQQRQLEHYNLTLQHFSF